MTKYNLISLQLTLVPSVQFNNFSGTDISTLDDCQLFKVYILQICYYFMYLTN